MIKQGETVLITDNVNDSLELFFAVYDGKLQLLGFGVYGQIK